jgi:hypothetical protein
MGSYAAQHAQRRQTAAQPSASGARLVVADLSDDDDEASSSATPEAPPRPDDSASGGRRGSGAPASSSRFLSPPDPDSDFEVHHVASSSAPRGAAALGALGGGGSALAQARVEAQLEEGDVLVHELERDLRKRLEEVQVGRPAGAQRSAARRHAREHAQSGLDSVVRKKVARGELLRSLKRVEVSSACWLRPVRARARTRPRACAERVLDVARRELVSEGDGHSARTVSWHRACRCDRL